MKFLIDFFPIILFFIAYKLGDIYIATATAIAAGFVQLALLKLTAHKIEKMHWITLALLIVLGGATILFQDEAFIKWKVTVVNALFALVFLGSQFIGQKNLTQRMMDSVFDMTAKQWMAINLSWVGFFLFLAVLNWYVAFQFDTDTWVNFKLFGLMGLTLVFIVIQTIVMANIGHMKTEQNEESDDGTDK